MNRVITILFHIRDSQLVLQASLLVPCFAVVTSRYTLRLYGLSPVLPPFLYSVFAPFFLCLFHSSYVNFVSFHVSKCLFYSIFYHSFLFLCFVLSFNLSSSFLQVYLFTYYLVLSFSVLHPHFLPSSSPFLLSYFLFLVP